MSVDTATSVPPMKQRSMPPTRVAKSIGGMFSDFIALTELQVKLLKRDTSETVQRTYISIAFVVIGIIVLLSCLPVGMLGVVYVLSETLNLGLSISFAIVVAIGLLVGIVSALIGYLKLKKAGNIFHRSQTEFVKNVDWLKSSLKRD